ncbi:MAG: Na/Pi cotransporter family protein [Ruminococcus sp.]|nr:Na/Pi cotransporter family protein [Ruminococcus sp.]
MDIFDALTLVGGLCLFLFGMNIMGQALERRAGSKLRALLEKLTTNRAAGLLTGLGVTAVIQSSSATTVMVVGFVNSGLMTLKQAINVIMGANVGTTVTAWVLSLSGIESSNIFVQMLKPTSFTPILALLGIIFYMFSKNSKKNDTGMILLGFATLMFGMDTMSGAVSGLKDVPAFADLFIMFKNPVLGVFAGAVLTAIIQSSSASVGILQALASTGKVSYGAAIPIIMGQNIGTCITAILSSVGANKNAKRAALIHLSFNVIGTAIILIMFCVIKGLLSPAILDDNASLMGIAVAHSAFNILCTLILLPMAGFLEKLVNKIVPDAKSEEDNSELDERLLATPPIALERCHKLAFEMADVAVKSLKDSMTALYNYSPELAESIREAEDVTDHYEDILGTYLVKLSSHKISAADSAESAKLLKIIGDFERISDHSVNILESAEELNEKGIVFTEKAIKEISVLTSAVSEILDLSLEAFVNNNLNAAAAIEPLEQVIDGLKKLLRNHHIVRLQQGECSIEAGFVWADLLTNLERTSDHCSNIAGCVVDITNSNMNLHESLREVRAGSLQYSENYESYVSKYSLAGI